MSRQYPLPDSKTTTCMELVPSNSTNQNDTTATNSSTIVKSSITKDQLKDYLRQWVRVENEISTLSVEIKKRKLIHQELSASLLKIMHDSEIDCFDISNGRIVYSKTKTRAPLNNGQLKTALTTYYKDEPEKANSIAEFLLASRVEKTRETIKMKIPKNK
jgi:uncharacterized protein (UPF0335 family)